MDRLADEHVDAEKAPQVRPYIWFGGRTAAGCLTLFVLAGIVFPTPVPVLLVGAVLGSLSALIAMGIVLIYRANRIINFAQGELGALAGLLGVLLMAGPSWPYLLAVPAGLLAALVLGGVVETTIVRRFARAPRLILTVATIGMAQLLAAGELVLPSLFGEDITPQDFPTPFDFTLDWDPVVFRGNHLMAVLVVAAATVGLTLFLNRTRAGIAVRAAAESGERAEQLGIPVRRLNLLVWMVAAGLSAAASLLRAPIVGIPIGQVLGPALLVRALAAAVIGRMESLPVTFAAAVVLGMVEQAVLWDTGTTAATDAVMFVVIVGALLIQRRGAASRAVDAAVSSWSAVREVRPVPPELKDLPAVRVARIALPGVAATAALVAPVLMAPSRVNLLTAGLLLAMVGLSLVVLTGWAGEISLGQVALFAVGAVIAAKAESAGWSIFAVLPAAGFGGAGVSLLIGLPALRIRGPFLAVSTLAFALATGTYFLSPSSFPWLIVTDRLDRPVIFNRFSLESEHAFYYVVLALLVAVFFSLRSFRRSRSGRTLVMSRENARSAQAFGVNVLRARLLAFAVSGFLAALAGGLFLYHQHGVGQSAFGAGESLEVFSMAVFGGLGSMAGVAAAAAYYTLIDYFIPLAELKFLLSGAGLLLVLLVIPGGLGQLFFDGRDSVLRWLARRRRIAVPSLLADGAVGDGDPSSEEAMRAVTQAARRGAADTLTVEAMGP